jgi:iron complex transport system substrate-binding protein
MTKFWTILFCGFLLVGCSNDRVKRHPSPKPGAATITNPQRIISLTPSLTELLFALGAGSKVVGVTKVDDYPPEVASIAKVGDLTVNWESLLKLRPDCVIYDEELSPDAGKKLADLHCPGRSFHSQSFGNLLLSTRELGQLLGREQQAKSLVAALEQSQTACANRSQDWKHKPKALIEVSGEPLIVAGKGSYVGDLLEMAGAENAAAKFPQKYPTINAEQLILMDPEVVILTDMTLEQAASKPGWKGLRAFKEGHVVKIEESLLVRPSPRLVQGLSQLQDALGPCALHE